MISAVGPQNTKKTKKNDGFYKTPELEKAIRESHPALMPSNPLSHSRIQVDKFLNAITVYPVKGFMGSPNANFYEFLTMGMVPYLVGSGTLMAVFNMATKYFEPSQAKHARNIGNKMALGVIFYGLLKSLSKKLIEVPVYLKTGIDINQPYRDVKSQLPERFGDPSGKDCKKSAEYHKVFESVDFPRWDLLYDYKKNKPRNYYYDRIAAKMGLGKNLPASDQVAKPKIRETVIRTRTWSTLCSYAWAGLGVALAVQDGWTDLLTNDQGGIIARIRSVIKDKSVNRKPLLIDLKNDIKRAFRESCEQLYNGGVNHSKTKALAGKTYIFTTLGLTLAGMFMSTFDIFNGKNNSEKSKINYKKDYTVG